MLQLTELGVALICWKWVTNSALLENWAWHSGHLKLWYCRASPFLQGSGIRARGFWGPRRAGLGWVEAVPGEGESFSGLEVDGTGVVPVVVVEDDRGGESIPREMRTFKIISLLTRWAFNKTSLSMKKGEKTNRCYITRKNRKELWSSLLPKT